jgi:hypothetical protein
MTADSLARIRDAWGASHFERSPAQLLAGLPLSPDAVALLKAIGLPTGPPAALALYLRFENVNIVHQPAALRLLTATNLEIGPAFPRTGRPELDAWIDLRRFVVLGEVPNDSSPFTRFLCADDIRGNVWWVYPTLSDQCTDCNFINSDLAAYLASLWAYRQFREEWSKLLEPYADHDPEAPIEDPAYLAQAEIIHTQFLERLEAADPSCFKGFWEEHAWNEHILMHS